MTGSSKFGLLLFGELAKRKVMELARNSTEREKRFRLPSLVSAILPLEQDLDPEVI